MSLLNVGSIVAARGDPSRLRRCLAGVLRVVTSVVVMVAVVGIAVSSAPAGSVEAGSPPAAGSQAQVAAPAGPSGFVAQSRRQLAVLESDLVRLAGPVFEGLGKGGRPEENVESQQLRVKAAELRVRYAQLQLQVAEMTLKEYQDRIIKMDRSAYEAELKASQADEKRLAQRIPQAKERLAKTKQAFKGSATDMVLWWSLEAAIASAELGHRKAQFGIEHAQTGLKVLDEYQEPKRLKELKAAIAKAKSDELASDATLGHEQAKLKTIVSRNETRGRLTKQQQQMVAWINRAIPIEETWSTKLGETEQGGEPGEARRRELTELAGRFQAIVAEARATAIAVDWTALKAQLEHRAGPSATTNVLLGDEQAEPAAADGGFLAESRRTLQDLKAEITRLGTRVLGDSDMDASAGDAAVSQQLAAKSAEAAYQTARLTREIAEIAVREYKEGTALQEQQTVDGELILARTDLARATDDPVDFQAQAARIKAASTGSAQDLAWESIYQDRAEDRAASEPVARHTVEAIEARRDQLREYTIPRRIKELEAEVEKARADETAREADWVSEKFKLALLPRVPGGANAGIDANRLRDIIEKVQKQAKEGGKRPPIDEARLLARLRELEKSQGKAAPRKGDSSRPVPENRGLALLNQAVQLAEQFEQNLNSIKADADASDTIRAGVAKRLGELRSLIESVRAEHSAAAWVRLKQRLRDVEQGSPTPERKAR